MTREPLIQSIRLEDNRLCEKKLFSRSDFQIHASKILNECPEKSELAIKPIQFCLKRQNAPLGPIEHTLPLQRGPGCLWSQVLTLG